MSSGGCWLWGLVVVTVLVFSSGGVEAQPQCSCPLPDICCEFICTLPVACPTQSVSGTPSGSVTPSCVSLSPSSSPSSSITSSQTPSSTNANPSWTRTQTPSRPRSLRPVEPPKTSKKEHAPTKPKGVGSSIGATHESRNCPANRYLCPNKSCKASLSQCDSLGSSADDEAIMRFTYHQKRNQTRDVMLRVETKSRMVGQVGFPVGTLKEGWRVTIRGEGCTDEECKKGRSSPVFNVKVWDSKGRKLRMRDLDPPLQIGIFSIPGSKRRGRKIKSRCMAFREDGDSKWQCMKGIKVINAHHDEMEWMTADVDHLTSFATLLGFGAVETGDTIWIISLSLLGAAIAFSSLVILAYAYSRAFRAFFKGFDREKELESVIRKVSEHGRRSATSSSNSSSG